MEKHSDVDHGMFPAAQDAIPAALAGAPSTARLNAELGEARIALVEERAARQRAEEAEREQRQLVQALRGNVAAIHRASGPDQVLAQILGNVGRVVPHTGANVMLIDEAGERAILAGACSCYDEQGRAPPHPERTFQISETPTLRRISATGKPLVIRDTACDPRWVGMSPLGWLRSYVGVPIRLDGQLIGFLNLDSDTPGAFSEGDARLLQVFADQSAIALRQSHMRARLERTAVELERLVHQRTRDLRTLYEVTTTTIQAPDLQVLLERVLVQALDAVGGDAGLIHLADGDGAGLQPAAHSGLSAEQMTRLHVSSSNDGPWAQVVSGGETVIVLDWRADYPTLAGPEGSRSCVGVPIRAGEDVLGALSVFAGSIEAFTAEDLALLTAIAHHVGVSVERARLREQAEQAVLLRERHRLAHELHDAVTQSLYGLTLLAGAGQDAARASDLARVEQLLGRLEETARQALKDMRLMIYDLHPPALTREGLAAALRQRLAAVEGRAGVATELTIDEPLGRQPKLPASVEAALYRIAQEALNNVLKHAEATRVRVRLAGGDDGEGLCLEVTDNGRGFDVESLADGTGMGLASIRERAESLGGTCRVLSQSGGGTRLIVHLPLAPVQSQSVTRS